ncbi:MAG: hypothetical protein FJW34_05765 [Acidobacteria bacterium]|nr:hypothetical protein [Acidobacteriota bacterium]
MRLILWDYERATWQYDLMVGLILAFIFLAPRAWFRDQPRVPQASRISMPAGAQGKVAFWLEAELLAAVAPEQRWSKAAEILKSRDGRKLELLGLEPVVDSDREIKGYVAFIKP